MTLPRYQQIDAPLLGNGDMAAAIDGVPEEQRFWLGKNDLWELRNVWCRSGPRAFGHLDIRIPLLQRAAYHLEQHLRDGTTVASFKSYEADVTMRSWVSATDNVLVVELTAAGTPVEGNVDLWVPAIGRTVPQIDHRPPPGMAPDWIGTPAAKVNDDGGGVYSTIRGFTDEVMVPAATACAFRVIGGQGHHFRLVPGHPVIVVAAMQSLRQSSDYLARARERVRTANPVNLATLFAIHTRWWRAFWDQSSVELGDPELAWRYHVSNYILACCSRDPDYPPGLPGAWVTTDQPMWTGAYTMNYNHEAVFYGLYSSNHLEQADPEDAPVLAFRARGEYYARAVLNCRGVLFPVKFGPVGIETTGDERHPNFVTGPGDPPWLREKGGLFLGQRSDAAFAAVNMAQRWYMTYDPDYGRKIYPFIRDVALFWEDYLKFEPTPATLIQATRDLPEGLKQPADGRYVSYRDGANEGGQDTNPSVSLALVRDILPLALDLSRELSVDAAERPKWAHLLAHLSGFPTVERQGGTVFGSAEAGRTSGISISPIYPAGAVGLGSNPKLLEVARNTITALDRWVDFNGSSGFFPAAARVGYDSNTILVKLHDLPFEANGIVSNAGHMVENCSIVPNTVDEMLLQSHEGILRFFPVWPAGRDVRFTTLRAYGAFLVSASLHAGRVAGVVIVSEKGRVCAVQNPWPGSRVQLISNGRPAKVLAGERLAFQTAPGDRLELLPAAD
jgi:alpha-L-fucosidase 2